MKNNIFKPTFCAFSPTVTGEMLSADNNGTKLKKGMVINMVRIQWYVVSFAAFLILFIGCGSSTTSPPTSASEQGIPSPSSIGRSFTLDAPSGYKLSSMLEVNDTLAFLYLEYSTDSATGSFIIETRTIETGELLGSCSSSDYPEMGALLRIDKACDLPNYDYRLLFVNGIVYYSEDKEEVYQLPIIRPLNYDTVQCYGNYDLYGNSLVYGTDEGIWIAARDGTTSALIVPRTLLAQQFPDVSDGLLANPRFINSGKDIVIGVYRTLSYEFTGAVTYSLAKQQTEHVLNVILPKNVVYPVEDRYVAARAWSFDNSIQLMDTTNGNVETFSYDERQLIASHDYRTFVSIRYGDYPNSAEIFINYLASINDTLQPLLMVDPTQNVQHAGIGAHYTCITEHFTALDIGGKLVIVKYL